MAVMVDTGEEEVENERGVVFQLPVLECVGVLRHQGMFGVVKATNVEIHEVWATGVAKVGGSELSEAIRSQTAKSILLGYSFLSPNYMVSLKKTRHARLNVLDASIEHANFRVTVAEDHALTKMVMKITNSNRQYLRVRLPENLVAIWSTFANSEPVSPVTDRDGTVLIPLSSTMGIDEGSIVEIVFLTHHEKLGHHGEVQLHVPALDVPINLLSAEIFFPSDLLPTFNSGSLKQVHSYSMAPPIFTSQSSTHFMRNSLENRKQQYTLEDNEGLSIVRVRMPEVGNSFRFEKLLAFDEQNTITINYASLDQPWKDIPGGGEEE